MLTEAERSAQLREALAALRRVIYPYQPWKRIPTTAYTPIAPEEYSQASGYVRVDGQIIAIDLGPGGRRRNTSRFFLYSLLTETEIGPGQWCWNHETVFHAWEPKKFRAARRYLRSFD